MDDEEMMMAFAAGLFEHFHHGEYEKTDFELLIYGKSSHIASLWTYMETSLPSLLIASTPCLICIIA